MLPFESRSNVNSFMHDVNIFFLFFSVWRLIIIAQHGRLPNLCFGMMMLINPQTLSGENASSSIFVGEDTDKLLITMNASGDAGKSRLFRVTRGWLVASRQSSVPWHEATCCSSTVQTQKYTKAYIYEENTHRQAFSGYWNGSWRRFKQHVSIRWTFLKVLDPGVTSFDLVSWTVYTI